ncbi:zf-DHHC-domain-containing protein [Hypoxylon rubiginosum]|uniref:Zf-DHHC-domain-containing protein n=1 Tax=Hypoxylon rubiginosum TaxID=110542 RepID=A0ACB9Z7D8_9PEZI|nr:zf-DHHC-domain-containing protein [Hypoxylon rubiginosum]
MAFLVGSTVPALQRLAIPAVCVLIAFLAYASQWLFAHAPDLAPGPLTPAETYTFNGLLLCLWYAYYKACTVDPGRYVFPSSVVTTKKNKNKKWGKDDDSDADELGEIYGGRGGRTQTRGRWCKKCAAPKPPRAHHCKTCRRCIPKMDHHCPWTSNCVSLQTFPHFLRFLIFTNLSLWTLLYFISQRFLALWASRHLPAYLGPTLPQLSLLTVLALVGGGTSFALGILLAATLKGWVFNTTMIEGWEVERHEAAVDRRFDAGSSASSWWAEEEGDGDGSGDDDALPQFPSDAVEFPYDVGIFANVAAAMGTRNPLLWFLPFAGGPEVANLAGRDGAGAGVGEMIGSGGGTGTGWEYEENGLNDREGLWPPPDPDKLRHARAWRRRRREADLALERARLAPPTDPLDERDAFRRRQERDLQSRRWETSQSRILGELEELPAVGDGDSYDDYDFVDEAYEYNGGGGNGRTGLEQQQRQQRPAVVVVGDGGGSGWTNADGEHLGDYGVDSDAEFDEPPPPVAQELIRNVDEEDEDVPLAELIRRRKVRTKDGEDT